MSVVGLTEPTLTTVEMHAGALMPFLYPSFPDDATVATPAARRASTETFAGSRSQGVRKCPPPRLMFAAATSNSGLWCSKYTHSSPLM